MSTWILLFINFNALIFLAAFVPGFKSLGGPVFFHALAFTVAQALVSAAASAAIGLAAAPGFARCGPFRKWLRWPLLLPSVMSPILVVLCLLLSFKNFPFGFWGIILGNLFLNAGFCAVWLGEEWLSLENRWGPVNEVLGGSTGFFYGKALLPLMIPKIRNTFAVVFAFCLASFAVPLVLGGGPSNSTLEVLVFERLHADADVKSAVAIGLVQCLVQFVVFVAILRPMLLKTERSRFLWRPPRLSAWFTVTAALTALSVYPLWALVRLGMTKSSLTALFSLGGFYEAAELSLAVSVAIAVLVFMTLGFLAGWGWKPRLLDVPALSGVAVGLAGLLLFKSWVPSRAAPVLAALIWGHFTVLALPIFRLSEPGLGSLRSKFEKVLNQMGVKRKFAFRKVYLPLGLSTYVAGAVLAGCWSFGEFSVATMVSSSRPSLPVYVHQLMGSYRLEPAAAAALVLLALSVISMSFFEVLANGMG